MREEFENLKVYLLETNPEFKKVVQETEKMNYREIAKKYNINMDIFLKQTK